MKVTPTRLADVLLIEPTRFGDARGFFSEIWNQRAFAEAGIQIDFVQDNHSLSTQAGTVRGLHFQTPPHAQAKLVRCARGALFDVAVDIRRNSPSFGQWVGQELSFENGKMLLIPEGFAHGFVARTADCEIHYKCSDFYSPQADGAIRWDSCGIDWGLPKDTAILSEKDRNAVALADFDSPFMVEASR